MALTDTDLREVLAARADLVPADSALARVSAVDRRVRVIRRRRAAGASLGVVVVVLVVTGLSGLFRDGLDRTGPLPAYQQTVAGGLLPRYTGGGQATAYTSFRTHEKRDVTFTFTPTSWKFLVAGACDKNMPGSYMVNYAVNGHPFMAGSCSRGLSTDGPSYGEERTRGEDLGLRLGQPATLRVSVVQTAKGSKASPETQPVYRGPMADYRIAVAVYSPMPVADYPFPPRPRTLASLDDGGGFAGGRLLGTVDSRSTGPNGHGSVVTTLSRKGVRVDIYAVAPGAVTVTVNGQTVDAPSFWTWTGSGYGGLALTPAMLHRLGINVTAGHRITVGFTGSRFSDPAWRAQVHEGR